MAAAEWLLALALLSSDTTTPPVHKRCLDPYQAMVLCDQAEDLFHAATKWERRANEKLVENRHLQEIIDTLTATTAAHPPAPAEPGSISVYVLMIGLLAALATGGALGALLGLQAGR